MFLSFCLLFSFYFIFGKNLVNIFGITRKSRHLTGDCMKMPHLMEFQSRHKPLAGHHV